jgi:DNA-binding YbaB/EbfC family protein
MGSGFSKMKKQAKLMQEQIAQAKSKMETTLVEGSAGGGLVKVSLNGSKELKRISINPECVSDIEALEDLIIAAFESASAQLEDKSPMPANMPFF